MKKYSLPLFLWLAFQILALFLWLTTKKSFYYFNFCYIGTALALGIILQIKKVKYARNFVLLTIGSYMLFYLGIFKRENMQIEGFWYYLFLGTWKAAVLHYVIAKIIGPLLFARGWCGYACWTAMVLDLLPYKTPNYPRKKLIFLPYLTFIFSFLLALLLFLFKKEDISEIMFISFIAGNIIYYILGIGLAFKLKDNRTFCKYVCPISILLKASSYYSPLRIKYKKQVCIDCQICLAVCPMEVNMRDNSRKRTNGTDCIICLACIDKCPTKALTI